MTPWLVTLRPFILSTDARDKLDRLRFNKSLDTILDDTWTARGEPSTIKASASGWPKKLGPQKAAPPLGAQSNVTAIRRKK